MQRSLIESFDNIRSASRRNFTSQHEVLFFTLNSHMHSFCVTALLQLPPLTTVTPALLPLTAACEACAVNCRCCAAQHKAGARLQGTAAAQTQQSSWHCPHLPVQELPPFHGSWCAPERAGHGLGAGSPPVFVNVVMCVCVFVLKQAIREQPHTGMNTHKYLPAC